MTRRTTKLAGFAGAAATLLASTALPTTASAEELRFAIGWPPNTNTSRTFETFGEVLSAETGGEMTAKVYPLSLLNFLESTTGVRDGIADLTTILLPYFLSDFPISNFGTELAALTDLVVEDGDRVGIVYAGAFMEWAMLNCPECMDEFSKNNSVFLGGGSSTRYHLICNKEVNTLEQLQGARIRAGGAWWARWASAMGATPVSMSINETFEGLNQGVLDCSASSNPELFNFGFIDVAKFVTTGAPGSQFPSATAVINKDVWLDASETEKTALLKAGAALAAGITFTYIGESQHGIAEAEKRGIPVKQAGPELMAKSRAHTESDAATVVANYTEKFGLKDGDAKVEQMKQLIDKWNGLTEGVADADALADIYFNEIMTKLDLSTYGQ
ncbi:C4-dicarboxylate TRAP transporter substrate-binding protein [Albimonas sp. CAU 1670]|uniref:C4-dicarboxylate TRAP transporter substrate-binding protein n=1 Tax=Albimonas sp. CAU 1670 TaxID=3032599 RepID=UPI0023DC6B87|nr:C4-dicarboxylate TRAP transporter substrate-binding protein [Albimonas sp. CAU 1670]MDF2232453.1 C4-dicarboxylate TRAP transporter substrate-binding protein [Albimonas sp. CAU 1670]